MILLNKKKFFIYSLVILFILFFSGCDREEASVEEYKVLTAVEGEGEIIKSPSQVEFSAGSEVNLLASPAEGWAFSHWMSDGSVFSETLEKSLDIKVADKIDMTAVFVPEDEILRTTVDGDGEITEKIIVSELDESQEENVIIPVQLEARPDQDWLFLGWIGVEEDKKFENPITVNRNEGLEIKAVFASGDYSLSLEISGGGRVKFEEVETSDEIKDKYFESKDIYREITSSENAEILLLEGSMIQITAIPETDWRFSKWEGDASGDENPAYIEITGDLNITAVFEEYEYFDLDTDTEGEGNIEINVTDLPFEITETYPTYPEGTLLELEAVSETGWSFIEWSSNLSNIDVKQNPLQINMEEDISLTAIFEKTHFMVDIEIEGEGEVEEKILSMPEDHSQLQTLYPPGSQLELTAIPESGWDFIEWQGDITEGSQNTNPIDFIIEDDLNIKVIFTESKEEVYYDLNLQIEGEGELEETLIDGDMDNGKYISGSEVEIKVNPDSGWNFDKWQGDISSDISSNNPVNVIMDEDKNITALMYQSEGDSSLNGSINIKHNWPYSQTYEESSEKANINMTVYESDFDTPEADYVQGEMIVGFQRMVLMNEQQQILKNLNLEVKKQHPILNSYLVETGKEGVKEAVSRILTEKGVRFAEPNYIYSAFSKLPDDEAFSHQWHYPQIRLPQAWENTTGSSSVRIGVLDTGIDSKHPDLQNNIIVEDGYNFPDDNNDTDDQQGHGTHVAGTIAADSNNEVGVAGVMWDAEIIPVKVLDDEGYGTNWDIAQGILYASGLTDDPEISSPVDIINMSLGGSTDSETIKEAIEEAYSAGVLLIAAAGNSNTTTPMYPASYPEVISVGAVELNYPESPVRAPYSCYGDTLDIMAPGGNTKVDTNDSGFADGVLSSTFEGSGDSKTYNYIFFQGTSMASPHVAGLAGLMLSRGINPSQIRDILHETAFDLGDEGFDTEFGYGLVNAYWAVNQVDSIRILIGELVDDSINEVVQTNIGLKDNNYNLDNIPGGTYRVYAWIDVTENGMVDAGDYLYESDDIVFDGGEYQLDIELEEIN